MTSIRYPVCTGSAASGRSSGEAIAAMEELAKKGLPNGMTFEWSGVSLEEIESGGKALILFALGSWSCT